MSKTSQRRISAFNQGKQDFKTYKNWYRHLPKDQKTAAMFSDFTMKINKIMKRHPLYPVWYAGFRAAGYRKGMVK